MKHFIQIFTTYTILLASLQAQELPKAPKQYLKQSQRYLSLYGISLGYGGNILDPVTRAILHPRTLATKFSLGYGQMITNKVMIGGRIGYNGLFALQKSTPRLGSYHTLSTELFGRYFFSQGRWNPFVELGVGAATLPMGAGQSFAVASLYQEARLGVMYHLNENLSLEFSNGIRFTQHNQNLPSMPPISPRASIGFLNPKLGINFRL